MVYVDIGYVMVQLLRILLAKRAVSLRLTALFFLSMLPKLGIKSSFYTKYDNPPFNILKHLAT